jgi:prophage regulatory protein
VEDPLYRPRDAAKYLGIGLTMLYALAKADKLPRPIKIGHRASGWRKSALDRFIAQREAAGMPAEQGAA